jgi:hypothetical protein
MECGDLVTVSGSKRESAMNMARTYTRCVIGVLVIGLSFACIVLPPSVAAASGTAHKVLSKLEFAVTPSVWYSLGEAGFEGDDEGWSWKLEYPLNGWMTEICAESRFPFVIGRHRFGTSLKGRYAHSMQISGTSIDTDCDSLGTMSVYSEADCEGDIIMWDIDATFFVRIPQQRIPVTLEVGALAGYRVQRFDFTRKNLHVTLSDGRPTNRHYQGVSSYYNMDLRSGRVGLFGDMRTREKLRYYLEVTYVPYLEASADALWVLRDYPFWQEAEGKGYTLTLRTSYTMWGRLSVLMGFRLVSLVADQGAVEGGVLDGIPYENEPFVSEITSKYFGIEVGAVLRF